MSVMCQKIIDAMDRLAPPHLAEAWDNIGLLVGSPVQNIERVLVGLDVTPQLLNQAIEQRVNLIITHHPLIFKALTSLRTDRYPGKLLAQLVKADIALFAAHTNLDAAAGGVSDVLAARLGLRDIRLLAPGQGERLFKLVVFVPESHVEAVRAAITAAGAGHIGNYSHCTFQTSGVGTFMPLAGTNPFIGKPGNLEYVSECRLETVLPERLGAKVVSAMLKAHPYEEVAYDLFSISGSLAGSGLGRVGVLPEPISLGELTVNVKTALGLAHIRLAGEAGQSVKVVAVCGGSGGSLLHQAKEAGTDVFITGDVKYHEAQEARELGLIIIDAGHYHTERPVVDVVVDHLKECAIRDDWAVTIGADELNEDVFRVL